MLHLDSQAINVLVSSIIPLLVGFLTRSTTSGAVKGVLLLFLSAVSGVLTQYLSAGSNSVNVTWYTLVISVLVSFGTAVATYFGIYKPAAVHSNLGGRLAGVGVKDRRDALVAPPAGVE